jgi:serine/threonine-protein kinase HipA
VSELLALIEGQVAARVRGDRYGRLSLEYEQDWLDAAQAYPLSVTLPLTTLTHPHKAVYPYLWNLLPENPNVLQRWGQQYHVSPANPFKLLSYVGADVPGAAQFIPPKDLEKIQSERRPRIEWLANDDLASRLRELRNDIAAVRKPGDIGKMSLPGAQAKTAYLWDQKTHRWGVPGGRTPTTHILKPCIPGFDGLVENEHLCQDIASRLQMPAAKTWVLTLDEPYIVSERYDRLPAATPSAFPGRIHQEDLCQALGLLPAKKYQEEGGPGIRQTIQLVRRESSEPETDVERFLKANAFNWLMGGTDAHAKNYSLLIAPEGEVRLAPLYDLSSQAPYPDLISQRVAMRIGEHYDIAEVSAEDWRSIAHDSNFEEDALLTMVTEMGRALPDEISAACDQAIADGLSQKVVSQFKQQLTAHVCERLTSITLPRARKRAPSRRPRRA